MINMAKQIPTGPESLEMITFINLLLFPDLLYRQRGKIYIPGTQDHQDFLVPAKSF